MKTQGLKYTLLLVFLFFAITRIIQTVNQFEQAKGLDFRTVYLGSKLLLNKQNPYDDALLKKTWADIIAEEKLVDELTLEPGLPHVPLLYQPYTLILFLPLAMLPYSVALPVWIGSCIVLLTILSIGIVRMTKYNIETQVIILLFLVGSTVLSRLALVGQPTVLFIVTGFLSIYLYKKEYFWLAGVLLFLTCFKTTLAVPFVIFFMIRHQWKILIISAGMLAVVHLGLMLAGFDLLKLYNDNLLLVQEYRSVHFLPQGDVKEFLLHISFSTELLIIPQYYFNAFYKIAPIIMLPIFVGVCAFLYVKNRQTQFSDVKIFLMLAVASLVFFHHLFYDQILLLPLVFLLPSAYRKIDLLLILFLAVVFLPIQGIFQRFDHYSILWLHKPVVLLCLLYWVWKSKEERETIFSA